MAAAVIAVISVAVAPLERGTAGAAGFVPISGSGFPSDVLDQWRRDLYDKGITVNYSASGSTNGRNDFRNGRVDFALSDLPYGLSDGGVLDPPPPWAFGYLPSIASGVAFMYNLRIDGNLVRNLRLSGDTITKIFTEQITNWSDPEIKADNPGLTLPARKIVPVVRSDSSGTTAQFTAWMASQFSSQWDDYCRRAGRTVIPCGSTSFYPTTSDMVSKAGSQGVAGFVAQQTSEGTITYVEPFYALQSGFTVVKMLNAANYYVEPNTTNVAIALLKAQLRPDHTADLSQVYGNPDPRAYPLSGVSYLIVPEDTSNNFSTEKGATLSEFAYYALCEGQDKADAPLPINLVRPAIDEAGLIPGSTKKVTSTNLQNCNNPTFSADGTDRLVTTAPQPQWCDFHGPTQCTAEIGTPGPPTPQPPTPTAVPPTPTPEPSPTPPVFVLLSPQLWQELIAWLLSALQLSPSSSG